MQFGQSMFLFGVFLFSYGHSQALPQLPEFPAPSPPASQSPLPSAIQDIIEEAQESASASPSEFIKSSPSPSVSFPSSTSVISPLPATPAASASPSISASPTPLNSEGNVVDSGTEESVENIIPSPKPTNNNQCNRDMSNPKPTLGKSQVRYAVSVLMSACAVALSSLLYGLAFDWEPDVEHSFARIFFIILSRLLIVGAVKVSASLVASITKASPEDGALDASGAFLTWGSAIFTRLYYEGFKMTMAALSLMTNDAIWDDKLKEFLNDGLQNTKDIESNNGDPSSIEITRQNSDSIISLKRISILKRLFGGRIERKLLLVTAALYFASEISVLISNVLVLVGAFIDDPEHVNYFTDETERTPCFTSGDISGTYQMKDCYPPGSMKF